MRVHRLTGWMLFGFALTVAPAVSAAPCAGFVDVQDTDQFCTEITWLRNRAITLGCTATQYCPAQFVRRDQMAAFLYRLGVQNAFLQGGNAFGTTATLGTTDDRALHINVNGSRALRVAPASNAGYGSSPNLIGGHPENTAAITCAGICIPTPEPVVGVVVGGGGRSGFPNRVTDSFGTIGGGFNNRAGDNDADQDDAHGATIAGGVQNTAVGAFSTIGGGADNQAGFGSTVGGGVFNLALGTFAAVPGGRSNNAFGDYSFAAGRRADASFRGCFVWADATDADFACGTANAFRARATGGVRFVTAVNPSGTDLAGVELLAGDSSWNVISDRAAKMNWREVDGHEVLDKLAAIPIGEWSYRAQSDAIRHMGPSAQDFRAAFGLGHGDLTISTVDADGVALAAIQGLAARDRARERAIEALQVRNAALEARNDALEAGLRELAAQVGALKASRRE